MERRGRGNVAKRKEKRQEKEKRKERMGAYST